MKILITGAAGFLGKGLVVPFEQHGQALRLMDVVPFTSPHEVVVGDVADAAAVGKAVAGVDGIVIAHMAPRGENNANYSTPEMAFNINVKGTANLFHAARWHGVKKVVVISSTSAIKDHRRDVMPHDLPIRAGDGYYGLSKACQEVIAEQFAREHGLQVACLRVGHILDGDRNVDKYGQAIAERNILDTDRRDIGEVARLCLECPDLTFETFNVMSVPEAMAAWDVNYTCTRLNWKPAHDFSWLPLGASPGTPEKKSRDP
ncbi:MAG: NAD(P)-dependent oxidoreductase [Lentisphaeria bacterium]|jgi:nucleoside-diphosphate-sugar epimerase